MICRFVTPTPSIAKMNLVPIIDVALTLVIILLITAPMLSVADLGLDLPQATTRTPPEENQLQISLARGGELAIGEDRVAPDRFRPVLGAWLASHEGDDVLVVIRADAKCSYREVGEVVRMAREAGARRIGIGTRPTEGGTS